jgi:Branched-chain amino acid transport system / permease component
VRLTWHYFAIITLVFSLIFYFLALTNKWLTGGDDGINFTLPPTFSLGDMTGSLADPTFQYFFILATVSMVFWLMHRLTCSPLGKAFLAIRDNDVRASLIGLNVYLLRVTRRLYCRPSSARYRLPFIHRPRPWVSTRRRRCSRRPQYLFDRRCQHALMRGELRQGLDDHLRRLCVGPKHDIQGAAEGVYFFENFPRTLAAKNDEFHKEFNKLIGIDDVYAREIGGKGVMDKSHGWQAWENIFAIKQAVETSGYKTRKDFEGVIKALEG